jgi:hypothetical protein
MALQRRVWVAFLFVTAQSEAISGEIDYASRSAFPDKSLSIADEIGAAKGTIFD